MSTAQIILAVILFGIAAALVIAGIRHLQCKGYCFNNAYIYASKDERESMYLRPYYKQSGIVFLMLACLFLLNGLRIVLKIKALMYISFVLIAVIIVYAVVSSIRIEKNK